MLFANQSKTLFMRHGHRLGLRSITTSTSSSVSSKSQKKIMQCLLLLGAASACGTSYAIQEQEQEHKQEHKQEQENMNMNTIMNTIMNTRNHTSITQCAALRKTGGDVVMLGPTEERATGILFPNLCNAMTFVGCGVRVKYGFVKVCCVMLAHRIILTQSPLTIIIHTYTTYYICM